MNARWIKITMNLVLFDKNATLDFTKGLVEMTLMYHTIGLI